MRLTLWRSVMGKKSGWRDLWESTKDSTNSALQNEKVKSALGASKDASIKAAKTTGKGLDKTRKVVTLEEQWSEAEAAIAELGELARVHHALIASLLERVQELESASNVGEAVEAS